MSWKSWLKAKVLLILIALIWGTFIIWMIPLQLPITVAGIHPKLRKWRYGFWIAQDQLVNAVFFGNPDITVSSKVGYMAEKGSNTAKAMAAVIDWIFYIAVGQENHCQISIERDEEHYL